MWNNTSVRKKYFFCILKNTFKLSWPRIWGIICLRPNEWQARTGRLACLPEEENAEAAVTDIASSGECQHCHYFWRQINGNYQTFPRDVNQSC